MFFLYSLSGKLENCRFIIRIKYPLLANYKLLRTKSKHLFRKDFIYLLTCNDTPTLKFNIIILYLLRLGGVFSWGGGGFIKLIFQVCFCWYKFQLQMLHEFWSFYKMVMMIIPTTPFYVLYCTLLQLPPHLLCNDWLS